MCWRRLTHSQYTHQRVVTTFGDLNTYYNEWDSTQISSALSYLAIIDGVGDEVHRFITTGAFPYEEWSEERPWTDEEEW